MKRISACVCTVLLFSLISTLSASAQNTYTDPGGMFSIDLPEGWKFTPSAEDTENKDPNLYLFGNWEDSPGQVVGQIQIAILPNAGDIDKAFSLALDGFMEDWSKATPSGRSTDIEVNGRPARWRPFKLPMKVKYAGISVKVPQFGVLGSVVLSEERSLSMFWFFPTDDHQKKRKREFEKVFQTLRAAD